MPDSLNARSCCLLKENETANPSGVTNVIMKVFGSGDLSMWTASAG